MTTKKRLTFTNTLTLGVLLFGLFFGSGNVIFPVKMGQLAGANAHWAALGFILTAASLPVLGVIASALSKREGLLGFCAPGGRVYAMGFTLALYLTIGPFFAIPRNSAVAFEVGVAPFVQGDTRGVLLVYTTIFFLLVLLFSLKPTRLMDIIGRVLTPLFLGLIAILLILVLVRPVDMPSIHEPTGAYLNQAVNQGILEGYNTMDALASLAFAVIITSNIGRLGIKDSRQTAAETAKAAVVTVLLFGLLYGGLTYLGASSRAITDMDANGGGILATVSRHYFGSFGQILLALTISVACLKTTIGLVVSIAQTFNRLFPRVAYHAWMIIFIVVSYIIANFGLNTIVAYSIPVLMFLYPLSMVMILLWIVGSFVPVTRLQFKLTLLFTGLAALLDGIKSAPGWISGAGFAIRLDTWAAQWLPFYNLGLGWVIPAAFGLVLGWGLMVARVDRTPKIHAVDIPEAITTEPQS